VEVAKEVKRCIIKQLAVLLCYGGRARGGLRPTYFVQCSSKKRTVQFYIGLAPALVHSDVIEWAFTLPCTFLHKAVLTVLNVKQTTIYGLAIEIQVGQSLDGVTKKSSMSACVKYIKML
jgi:hypothetical protein